ncbi:unnamed protein product [Prorocentrum cordatum]|uniref:RNA helicase n=1 Tax=Prorocentrum cordatum TaxID=2364126 RepID=A0ABN9PH99_9DINO|nr:unnamed protein product [Polarella glacialis]
MARENFLRGAAMPEDRQAKQARQTGGAGARREARRADSARPARGGAAGARGQSLPRVPRAESDQGDALRRDEGGSGELREERPRPEGARAGHPSTPCDGGGPPHEEGLAGRRQPAARADRESSDGVRRLKKLGRHILEFRGYETKGRGHRFRVNVNPTAPEDFRKAFDLIFKDWATKEEEVMGPAPPSKRGGQMQARIRRLK